MTEVLALASALMYGMSDFAGGLLARRTSVWAVAVVTQVTSLLLIGVAAVLLPGRPAGADLAWGALGGVGTGIGTAFLYRGLASGKMGVVAPLSAVGATIVPVAVGLVTGERPSLLTWGGIVCAVPAIWLVSSAADRVAETGAARRIGEGVADGLLAGLGFGVFFAALGQVPEGAGLGPVVVVEVFAIITVILLAVLFREPWIPRDVESLSAIGVGALAVGATVLFLLASQSGLLTVAAVLSSLYPAFTVVLAATVLREPIRGSQGMGLVLATFAVALVAAG